ncbi:MAG: membrane protein insertion efficiency factor YidD [Candidatus Puniceispirillum sp.]|nr:membrane protein insertion efficiency factor YidD [Candidatus Pelagibacter sp.]MBA4283257.1 membrane protein insertion efficiency factor YidD [Candidatus Puniceispirillum sp.]
MVWLLVKFIKLYQLIVAPFVQTQCRFLPTCSQYAIVALQAHGIFRGGWMVLKRLMCCQPFGKGNAHNVNSFTYDIEKQAAPNGLINKK